LLHSLTAAAGLLDAIEQERSSSDSFSNQPFYYMEQACLLLQHAKDAFPEDEYFKVMARCSQQHSGR